jgi:hypothetical protein
MQIDLDFSELFHSRGDYPDKISQGEIHSVYQNPKNKFQEIAGYSRQEFFHLVCPYSNSKRILLIVGKFENNKIKILQVKVADEEEIETYYCK